MLLRLSSTSPFHVRGRPRCCEVASNDVYVVPLGDFPELAQELFCDSSPLRGRVAQVKEASVRQ